MRERLSSLNGYQLCSSRDPIREARQWCDHLEATEAYLGRSSDLTHYWIVGLGAGYHIQELALRKPQSVISVIDPRAECHESFSEIAKELSGQVILESVETSQELFCSNSFKIFASSTIAVYKFLPSLQKIESWAATIENSILGQTVESFQEIAQLMSLSINTNRGSNDAHAAVSIKDINTFLDGRVDGQERQMISLLRELVR